MAAKTDSKDVAAHPSTRPRVATASPGSPAARFEGLMRELETRFPHPKPWDSTKAPEQYALEALDSVLAGASSPHGGDVAPAACVSNALEALNEAIQPGVNKSEMREAMAQAIRSLRKLAGVYSPSRGSLTAQPSN